MPGLGARAPRLAAVPPAVRVPACVCRSRILTRPGGSAVPAAASASELDLEVCACRRPSFVIVWTWSVFGSEKLSF